MTGVQSINHPCKISRVVDDLKVRELMATPTQASIDLARAQLEKQPQVECPVQHSFTPGLYARTIFMPKGTFIISKIHKTEHPYVITKGIAAVWIEGVGVKILTAPYRGITKPATRRVLYIHEDCEWTTFHPTEKTSVDEVEAEIILPHDDIVDLSSEILTELKGSN